MVYKGLEVITEGYPKVMLVSDHLTERPEERLVVCETPKTEYPFKGLHSLGGIELFRYAKDIPTSEKPNRVIEDGLVEGDILIDGSEKRKVLGVCGEVIFVSREDKFDEVASYYTLIDLIDSGYKLKQSQTTWGIIELTIQDISEGKGNGIDPSLIRIKE